MPDLPSGTVTFLLTDIEGSTRLIHQLKDAYTDALVECRRIVRAAVEDRGGREVSTGGDAIFAAFTSARDAVSAAITAQRRILVHPWPGGAAVLLRMGLHTGEADVVNTGYEGLDVHRTARICAAGHGGQILVSEAVRALVNRDLPEGVTLRDLGEHRLKDLSHADRLFQVIAPDLPAEFPPLRSLDARPHNLPLQLTSFVGRAHEITELRHLLRERRLLTLTGPGGVGKTRLALRLAVEEVDGRPDGVWLVALAALTNPEFVLQTLAAALSLREVPGRPLLATLLDYLRAKQLLLVVDNCEHVIAACAEVTEAITRACPNVHILTTSREPLGVPGEAVWPVPFLSLPDARSTHSPEQLRHYEGIELFLERAAAAQREFGLTHRNASTVAAICRRLEGIPLAIELAAARMRTMSVEQIAARLDERFQILSGGGRTVSPRQQTLRGALDWSYDLLSPHERRLLSRLSVFAGGWTLEDAEAVCAGDGLEARDILDLLGQLVFKSLVLVDAQEADFRYRLLDTVREYSAEKLQQSGDAADLRMRHLNRYLSLAERAEPELTGAEQTAWLKRLEAEHDNLRTALGWSAAEPRCRQDGLRLARALSQFWYVRGHVSEGRTWLEAALAGNPDASPSLRAKALAAAGLLACRQGDYDSGAGLCTQSLAAFRALGDVSGAAQALYALAMIAESQGRYDPAQALLAESLSLGRQAGDKRRLAVCLNSIGEVARCQEDYETARRSYEESLALSRELQDARTIAITLGNLGHVALYLGDAARAASLFGEALSLARQLMYKLGIAEYLAGLGGVAAAEGRHDRAARLLGAAQEVLTLLGALLRPPDRAEYDRSIAAARAGLAPEAFAAAWADGTSMTLEHAVDYALQTHAPGGAAYQAGEHRSPQSDPSAT
ncbi:MAG TPA: tetratricopeptide repeat protein [bacterium]|nr:tetratricopeptide repeat protein [bacterium]